MIDWTLSRIKAEKQKEVYERQLIKATKSLEERLGHELPDGACVCRIEKGHYALTMDAFTDDLEVIKTMFELSMMGNEAKITDTDEIRDSCSGIYLRK